ncbi:translation initiation factor IF-2 [Drosophila subpulchrella]|uniref:translation initiation factor IF-2 n=1 Tax=Drosophila subpulchrella TaxID=1486046 RepID=UPI0018A1335C|nr:translation initiation factor IF-2 [Drosophila subpulchrella]
MKAVYILVLVCCFVLMHEGQADEKGILPIGYPIFRGRRAVSSFANAGQPRGPGRPGRPGRPGLPGGRGKGKPGQPGSPGSPGGPGGAGGAGGSGGTGGDGGSGGAGGRAIRGGSWRTGMSLGQRRPEPRSNDFLY